MADYWTGLIEGFQGRRESEYKKNYEREVQNRQLSDRVFQHLLASRDPELQSLALSGMMNPISRKKGFRGFLGEIEANPFLDRIVSRMNEEVPVESTAPTPPQGPPPPPGSAAMSTNTPVEPGSAPIEASPESALSVGMGDEMGGPPPGPPPGLMGAMGAPPAGPFGGPPPESKFKRRGTMVPTAEEIAEAKMRAELTAKISTATAFLQKAGGTPDEIQQMIMGMMGAPVNARNLSTVTQWGVKIPGSDTVQPVLLDQGKGYVLAGGQPLPPGSTMVRMSGGGTGGSLTSTVEDSPEARQQLIALGADPAVIARGTATKYWRIRQAGDGTVLVQPGEYAPPPAYSGTIEGTDPTLPTVPVRRPVLRGGGVGPPLADVDQPVKSKTQQDAEALLEAVNKEVELLQASALGRARGIQPERRNQIVAEKARAAQLPYKTYDELLAATKATPQVSARERATGGTNAERVRARALEIMQQRKDLSTPPPQRPSARSQGAGPGPRQ